MKNSEIKKRNFRKTDYQILLIILAIALVFFVLELGKTGLFDETPPLFAAAGRGMSITGDWLTPRVNGLPRFDKPPLVYWLMSFVYSLPFNEYWDPLGTWAARLPSAISSLLLMVLIGDTFLRYPIANDPSPKRSALIASLSFGLSPLVMIWGRIAVSDALLCATFGGCMLFFWRFYVDPSYFSWAFAWILLGLAVLVKGPVAIILAACSLFLFSLIRNDINFLLVKLRPIYGLFVSSFIALPWYIAEIIVEGKPFINSFFGYHNFQRFTSVVNSHSEPWWFFVLIFIISSLPFTPILIFSIYKFLYSFFNFKSNQLSRKDSINSFIDFSASWLIVVFFLFSFSATKLPSYWLPATPAAAILIGLAPSLVKKKSPLLEFSLSCSALLCFLLAIVFGATPLWAPLIKDPEMPSLAAELIASRIWLRAAICLTACGAIGFLFGSRIKSWRLLIMQLQLALMHFLIIIPIFSLGDRLRQLPLRNAASLLLSSQKPNEPLAMVGSAKPSLHFYTEQVIVFEGRSSGALVNLSERLSLERRQGWTGRPLREKNSSMTALVVIDRKALSRPYWNNLDPEFIGKYGIYSVLRFDRRLLEKRAKEIISKGISPDWRLDRPERF